MDLNEKHLQENALVLLKGIWYSELPPIIDFENLSSNILNALDDIQNKKSNSFALDSENFICEFKNICSPSYIRPNGVEGIVFYDFKQNQTIREMQIPNLKHYIAFIYNTLFMYDDIFQELYLNDDNNHIIKNSNSYLMFEKTFTISSVYDDFTQEIDAGMFAEKNNKITGSAMLDKNKYRYYQTQDSYLYKMKIDLESFFPNLYTHYFHRIHHKKPYDVLNFPEKYFAFLDLFHQRINDNQTKGIPAGVFSSHVAAELCMLCIDYKINSLIKDKNISYVRYVDDFTFFANSQELLESLKIQIQQILNEFRLRINGNKTETMPCVFDCPAVDFEEIKITLPWLVHFDKSLFYEQKLGHFKKYISRLLKEKNYSQIKTCLSLLFNKIHSNNLDFINTDFDCFIYLIQLSQTNAILAGKAYKVINEIISKSENRTKFLNKLNSLSDDIDLNFTNTILQIWHYYVISLYSNKSETNNLISRLNENNNNPVILSSFVLSSINQNKELFNYIVNDYTKLSGKNNWKSEIMNSKYWLPLFVIKLKDGKNYENWFDSDLYPDIFKNFSAKI